MVLNIPGSVCLSHCPPLPAPALSFDSGNNEPESRASDAAGCWLDTLQLQRGRPAVGCAGEKPSQGHAEFSGLSRASGLICGYSGSVTIKK